VKSGFAPLIANDLSLRRAQFDPPPSNRRAITCAWISAAPSKIDRMRASHRMREIGYSSAKPLPPRHGWAAARHDERAEADSSFVHGTMLGDPKGRRPGEH